MTDHEGVTYQDKDGRTAQIEVLENGDYYWLSLTPDGEIFSDGETSDVEVAKRNAIEAIRDMP